MKFKYALLTINKRLEDPMTVDICFDWRTFEGEHADERWAQVKSWRFPHENLETLFEILGRERKDESILFAMGDQIWRLFPPNIQDSLIKFDRFAEEIYKKSRSLLPLIIFTDCLNIPWELCISRIDIPEDQQIPWYKRFVVAVEVYGVSRFDEITSEKERKTVALILTPFPRMEEEEGLEDELNNLLKLINYLESEYNINISLHRCPKRTNELYNIENVLQKGDHDLLMYVGSRANKKITLYNPGTKKPEYFEMKKICSGSGVETALFLDACSTAIEKVDTAFICEEPGKFLCRTTAFIGTIADIRMTPAISFASHFLESLFTKGSSLSEAIFDAKNQTYKALNEKYPNKEEYRTQSCFFSLYGRNDDILLNSFQYPRKKISFIYPKMIEQHMLGFIDFICPSSLPILELNKKDTLQEIIDEIEHLDGGFIADLSISHATNLISNCRGDPDKELVIIGGVFKLLPKPCDSTLYFFDKLSDYDFFYSLDPLTTVNIMAITYFINCDETKKKFVCKSSQRRMNYPEIYANALDAIEHDTAFEPFILIGTYRERFEEELKKRNLKKNFNRIPLYSKFLNILKESYPKYKFSQNLPAEVLVARRKDLEKDKMMYREIFTKWTYWEIENKDRVPSGQEIFISLTSEDIDTLMKFTRFVSEELTKFSYIKEPLKDSDFLIIQPWEEAKLENVVFQPKRKYMERATRIARKCKGYPKVGCVIVIENNKIIEAYRGEKKNEKNRSDHAESIALRKCGTTDLRNAILYTTLEPCTGRKHPDLSCADKILQARIKKVIIGTCDPNPDIHCNGKDKLRRGKVAVYHFAHDLENELFKLNKEFYGRFQSSSLPNKFLRKKKKDNLDVLHEDK